MAEEFQGGVCGGNWWNLSRNIFGSSPCSLASNDAGSFGWPNHDLIMDMKATRSGDDSAGSATDGSSSILLHDVQKPQPQTTANGGMLVDSNLPLMGNTLSPSIPTPHGWNPNLLHDGGRSDENYSNIPQEAAALNSGMNYQHETKVDFPQIHEEDWSSNNISPDSSINTVKQVNQSFPLEHHQPLNTITSSSELSETLSAGFPFNSSSYGYTCSILQTLFDIDTDQPKQSLSENPAMNYLSAANNQANSNEFMPSLPNSPPMVNPTLAKQQLNNHFPFSKNAPARNPAAAALSNVRGSFLPSTQTQLLSSSLNFNNHNFPSFNATRQNEAARDTSSVAKKASNEPTVKRPRIQTPSPLPTFKVRKEKLGDRITALQQLVSPFGKTDTASVLHEAIEYIKFLHAQVSVLSAPYLKKVLHRQQATDNLKDGEGHIQDLKSAGLCLVPISVTFPVAADATTDFWTPTFGGRLK